MLSAHHFLAAIIFTGWVLQILGGCLAGYTLAVTRDERLPIDRHMRIIALLYMTGVALLLCGCTAWVLYFFALRY